MAEPAWASPATPESPDPNTLLSQGKRDFYCGEYSTAVNNFQEACRVLALKYGETGDECGEAYLYYGKALLELARAETGVLGNALDAEEESSESEEKEDDDTEVGKNEKVSEGAIDSSEIPSTSCTVFPTPDKELKLNDSNLLKEKVKKLPETEDNSNLIKVSTEVAAQSSADETTELIIKESEAGVSKSTDEKMDVDEVKVDNGAEAQEESSENNEKIDEQNESKKEEEEDVSNLQVAWEILELAKIIFGRHETQEMQLKKAEVHLKLGEVGLESGNYDQSVEDFKECLEIQKRTLKPEDRLIAETYYNLGMAYSLNNYHDTAIENFRQAMKVIENRINILSHLIADFESGKESVGEPLIGAHKELEELKSLLPDISLKIEDTEDLKRNAEEKIKLAFSEASKSAVLQSLQDGAGTSSSSTEPKPISNISHLVRKKRKTDEIKETGIKKLCTEVDQNNSLHLVKEAVSKSHDKDELLQQDEHEPMEIADNIVLSTLNQSTLDISKCSSDSTIEALQSENVLNVDVHSGIESKKMSDKAETNEQYFKETVETSVGLGSLCEVRPDIELINKQIELTSTKDIDSEIVSIIKTDTQETSANSSISKQTLDNVESEFSPKVNNLLDKNNTCESSITDSVVCNELLINENTKSGSASVNSSLETDNKLIVLNVEVQKAEIIVDTESASKIIENIELSEKNLEITNTKISQEHTHTDSKTLEEISVNSENESKNDENSVELKTDVNIIEKCKFDIDTVKESKLNVVAADECKLNVNIIDKTTNNVDILKDSKIGVDILERSKLDVSAVEKSKIDMEIMEETKSDTDVIEPTYDNLDTVEKSKVEVDPTEQSKEDVDTVTQAKIDLIITEQSEVNVDIVKQSNVSIESVQQSEIDKDTVKKCKIDMDIIEKPDINLNTIEESNIRIESINKPKIVAETDIHCICDAVAVEECKMDVGIIEDSEIIVGVDKSKIDAKTVEEFRLDEEIVEESKMDADIADELQGDVISKIGVKIVKESKSNVEIMEESKIDAVTIDNCNINMEIPEDSKIYSETAMDTEIDIESLEKSKPDVEIMQESLLEQQKIVENVEKSIDTEVNEKEYKLNLVSTSSKSIIFTEEVKPKSLPEVPKIAIDVTETCTDRSVLEDKLISEVPKINDNVIENSNESEIPIETLKDDLILVENKVSTIIVPQSKDYSTNLDEISKADVLKKQKIYTTAVDTTQNDPSLEAHTVVEKSLVNKAIDECKIDLVSNCSAVQKEFTFNETNYIADNLPSVLSKSSQDVLPLVSSTSDMQEAKSNMDYGDKFKMDVECTSNSNINVHVTSESNIDVEAVDESNVDVEAMDEDNVVDVEAMEEDNVDVEAVADVKIDVETLDEVKVDVESMDETNIDIESVDRVAVVDNKANESVGSREEKDKTETILIHQINNFEKSHLKSDFLDNSCIIPSINQSITENNQLIDVPTNTGLSSCSSSIELDDNIDSEQQLSKLKTSISELQNMKNAEHKIEANADQTENLAISEDSDILSKNNILEPVNLTVEQNIPDKDLSLNQSENQGSFHSVNVDIKESETEERMSEICKENLEVRISKNIENLEEHGAEKVLNEKKEIIESKIEEINVLDLKSHDNQNVTCDQSMEILQTNVCASIVGPKREPEIEEMDEEISEAPSVQEKEILANGNIELKDATNVDIETESQHNISSENSTTLNGNENAEILEAKSEIVSKSAGVKSEESISVEEPITSA